MSRNIEVEGLRIVANLMCVAARTAPKTKGIDNLVISIIDGNENAENIRYCQ